MKVHDVAVGLGANLHHPRATVLSGWASLSCLPQIEPIAFSSLYQSQPIGFQTENWFVNAAALVRTSLSALELLAALQSIEHQHGRVRDPSASGYQDRTLDLDLLLYDDLIMNAPTLTVPHGLMSARLFVLEPLAEIAPERIHPVLQTTIGTLCAKLKSEVAPQKVEKLF